MTADAMRGRRRWLRAGVYTAWAGAAGALCSLGPAAVAAPARAGEPVNWPEVSLLDGSRWGAAQAQGHAVVVVLWSLTCPFCVRHNTHLTQLNRGLGNRALRILTAVRERDAAGTRRHMARHGHDFPVTLDFEPLAAALATRRITPLTITVDRQGRLLQVIPGEMTEDDVLGLAQLAA